MERVIRGRSFTLTKTFYSDGVATDPTGSPTVVITRDDGTTVTTGTVVNETAVGTWSVTVAASENDALDRLTATWTATVSGEPQTYADIVEVAGDVLFTVAEARAQPGLSTKTAAEIAEARTYVESELERECGVAFVPRYSRTLVSGNGRSTLMLPPRVTAIRSVSLDGIAVAQSYLDTMRLLNTGELYYPSWWSQGYANYEIAFEHGYSDGAERMAAKQAALTFVKHHLVKGPIDDRTTAFSTEDGTFSMSTPGVRGAITGIPAVDSFIQRYSLVVAVA